jgi:hypothetical protein
MLHCGISGTRFANTYIQDNVRIIKISQEGLIMETSLISTFAGLSIFLGLLVGFGTLSVIRGVFTFLMFIGLALSAYLNTVGVNMILSYFLGQLIVMGSIYILLRNVYPEAIVKVKQEFQHGSGKCH